MLRNLCLLALGLCLTSCMLSPRQKTVRRAHPALNDLDNLEMLLADDQADNFISIQESENLRLGMEKNRVKRALGSPNQVEVAGNPKYGNERWIYEKSVPTLGGYFEEKQIIYFENGNVVGWESQ